MATTPLIPSTLVDLVKIYTTNRGAGALTLGQPVAGYRGTEALTAGTKYSYSIQNDGNFEIGTGTYLSQTKGLARTPLFSSNGGQPVDFPAGVAVAFVALAEDLQALANLSVQAVDLVAKIGQYTPLFTSAIEAAGAATTAASSAGGYAGQAQGYANTALLYRDTTAQAASTALAALAASPSGQYQTISAGLAATAPNGFFYVASGGDVATTLYQKDSNGNAVLVNFLPGQSALDRIGRFVSAIANVDNAPTINAVLAQATVSGVLLPPGDIRIDDAIFVPSGRFLRGAGRGVTRLLRTDNIASYSDDQALHKSVVIVSSAIGVYLSDFDAIAPKLAPGSILKCNAVWAEGSNLVIAERIRAYNAGYSFWARGSYDVTYRDVQSFNGNVHFEATNGHRVLFDAFLSGDGDGDNTLGCEAHCHTLYDSTDITFRNGVTSGKGQPVLIVNDGVGKMDNILVENLRSYSPTSTVMIFATLRTDSQIGKVRIHDSEMLGDQGMPGPILQVQGSGDYLVRNSNLRGYAADAIQAGPGTSLRLIDNTITVSAQSDDDAGSVFTGLGGQNNQAGTISVSGGEVRAPTGKSVRLTNIDTCSVSPQTQITHVNPFYTPPAIGGALVLTTATDLNDDPSNPSFQYVTLPGGRAYFRSPTDNTPMRLRLQWKGKLKKLSTGSDSLTVGSDSNVAFLYGGTKLEMSDGSMPLSRGIGAAVQAATGDVREFDIDFTVLCNGIGLGFGTGATLLAGSEMIVTRLS